jgi:hypothetical protein
MLHIDTQNFGQGGRTRPFAEMLKAVWDTAEVPAETIPTPQPDNVHLIARIKGTTSAAPALMLGHSDVVPVERANRDVDPFGAVVRQGQIWGRGALTDCDEEAGSYGSSWLAESHWDKLDAGMVLTEGRWFLAQRNAGRRC